MNAASIARPMQRYLVDLVNNRTGETRTMEVRALGPEDARAFALIDAFRILHWRSVSASEAGKAVVR